MADVYGKVETPESLKPAAALTALDGDLPRGKYPLHILSLLQ